MSEGGREGRRKGRMEGRREGGMKVGRGGWRDRGEKGREGTTEREIERREGVRFFSHVKYVLVCFTGPLPLIQKLSTISVWYCRA